jgi:hypothetical protein
VTVEVDDTSSIVGEHDEDEEYPQARGGHCEEIDGDQVPDVVGEERPPALGGRCVPLREQPGDGPLCHLDAELHELALDSGRAPHGIRLGHSSDEGGDLRVDRRTVIPIYQSLGTKEEKGA